MFSVIVRCSVWWTWLFTLSTYLRHEIYSLILMSSMPVICCCSSVCVTFRSITLKHSLPRSWTATLFLNKFSEITPEMYHLLCYWYILEHSDVSQLLVCSISLNNGKISYLLQIYMQYYTEWYFSLRKSLNLINMPAIIKETADRSKLLGMIISTELNTNSQRNWSWILPLSNPHILHNWKTQ